ncbi:MAG: hypothetical protein ACE3L7_07295 [Candidatus Pristimantibacillus sp.]
MASGCIMGECPYCRELVWEDGWTMDRFDRICCVGCRSKAGAKAAMELKLKIMQEALERLNSESMIATEALFKAREIDGQI